MNKSTNQFSSPLFSGKERTILSASSATLVCVEDLSMYRIRCSHDGAHADDLVGIATMGVYTAINIRDEV